ncbi:uncharacterized protein BO97DRAFT_145379 [Aspergillus homomorphus CBS 101889]|uniref:Uncharacterized protein n=1 Tax=Aspergillus homomorphus (strain CBS 101889) TaxID=1450537 RepID=A0A395HQC0_ASPHC|nr:hypothetical protein BO97DRAFT_145379 [Aspergillus homomorphus CBS 101889]RAL10017.1 hypothetical protein BO97DRAFT_145379 [Aspergillus homomorphus CBS 101889]
MGEIAQTCPISSLLMCSCSVSWGCVLVGMPRTTSLHSPTQLNSSITPSSEQFTRYPIHPPYSPMIPSNRSTSRDHPPTIRINSCTPTSLSQGNIHKQERNIHRNPRTSTTQPTYPRTTAI